MGKSILKLAAALSILFFISSNVLAQDTYNFQYKFAKGSTFIYNSDVVTHLTQKIMGKEMKTSNSLHKVDRYHVDDVFDNGDIKFTTSSDSVIGKSTFLDKDTTYQLTGLVGKRIQCLISKLGYVKSCIIIDSIGRPNNGIESKPNELRKFFREFSDKGVRIGDSWNSSATDTLNNSGGQVITTSDMTSILIGKETKLGFDCFKVTTTGKTKISGKGKMQGKDFTMSGSGISSGMYYFDSKTGLVVFSEGTMENQITIGATGQQGMIIPSEQNMKYSAILISH